MKPSPATASVPPVRVMTINMHKGFNFLNRRFVLHELREAIRASGADLVFLQEVLAVHHRHARRHPTWPTHPQYEFLADSVWPQYAYGQNAVYPDGDHGNALLSRYPILRHDNIDVSVAGHEARGLLHCVISLPDSGNEIHAICVHLGLFDAQRTAQIERLVEHVQRCIPADAALIIAGDFNDWRQRVAPVLEAAGLREVFVERHGKAAKTFPGRWPVLRLDRIYVRGLRILEASVLDTHPWPHLSDHVPLFAQVAHA